MTRVKKIDWNKYTSFQKRVLQYITRIPKGKTMTYGTVAKALGNRHLARAVGGALAANKDLPRIPCHRVVGYNSMGGYSGKGGVRGKIKLLKQEGFKQLT